MRSSAARFIADVADQRRKPAAQPRSFVVCHRRLLGHALTLACISLIHAARKFALALDDFGREPQIGFAADAFEIVDQHRLAVGRRFGDAHVARNDGVVDLLRP